MISLIRHTISAVLPQLSCKPEELSFLKYSTPTSGTYPNDKVIVLVFEPKARTPFLCVKTVRHYGAKENILRSFNNLKRLNELTAGSTSRGLFAEALYLYDDGEFVFSIETACPGKRVKLDYEKLGAVVEAYIRFQEHIAVGPLRDADDLALNTMSGCGLGTSDRQELLQFFNTLQGSSMQLPCVIQHGDVTEDNMLFTSADVCFVDYDLVGLVDLPGFDLFGLFRRFNHGEVAALCRKYLPSYFEKIGANVESDNYIRLLFLYFVAEHTLRKPHLRYTITAKRLIADFSHSFPI